MKRVLRWVASVLAGLTLLALVGATWFLRTRRAASGPVDEVLPNLVHARNFFCDVYAARAGDGAVLFDAGMDPQGRAIDEMLKMLGVAGSEVTHVFLTHGHFDHVAAAALFPRAQVHIGSADLDMLAHREAARPLTPRVFGALTGSVPFEANSPLLDRRRIDVGAGETVLAIPFPGHTPGSFVYLFHGVLFSGDSINFENGNLTPAVRSHSVNPPGNRASIRALFSVIGGAQLDRVCTGHMGCTAPGSAAALLRDLVDSLR
jgi:glyoxylase-like metal-dependent hydrolase (beta-lactamase superfamily II)